MFGVLAIVFYFDPPHANSGSADPANPNRCAVTRGSSRHLLYRREGLEEKIAGMAEHIDSALQAGFSRCRRAVTPPGLCGIEKNGLTETVCLAFKATN
jgi:hypothetical protein